MIKKMRLKVEGMFCAHCSKSVGETFDKVGIKANVNLAKNEVVFSYDDEKISLIYLQRLVKKAGYTLVIDDKRKINFNLISLILAIAILVFSLVSMIGHLGLHNAFFHALNNQYVQLSVASVALVCLGTPFVIRAIKEAKYKRFGMDFLIAFASTIAYALSIYTVIKGRENYFHAVSMILSVISVGHYISDRLKTLNGNETRDVASYAAKTALVKVGENYVESDADDVEEGDLVKVVSGSIIPVDGVVYQGTTSIDEKVLTGESRPKEAHVGDSVYAATTNLGNPIIVQATKSSLDSLFTNIVNESYVLDNSRGRLNKLSDKLASYFVPFVILIAIIAFLINFLAFKQGFETSLVDAVAVLVVSCPCAFGLAVPLSSLNGYYLALKNGILFKSGDTFERVKKINKIFFDKTGTLTKGELKIADIAGDKKYLGVVKSLEQNSSHPLAKSLVSELSDVASTSVDEIEEVKGQGLKGKDYKLGSLSFVGFDNIKDQEIKEFITKNETKTTIYLSYQDVVVLAIAMEDALRDDALETIKELQGQGIETYMLTGDNLGYAKAVGQELGIAMDHIYAGVTPNEKGEIIKENRVDKDTICFVGDGINDLLALQSSDLSIASYSAQDIASDKAEVKLLKDELSLIPRTVKLSRHVYFNILENFGWAFVYNAVMIPLAMMGKLSPTISSVLMITSNITLILNSLRIRFWKGGK